MDLASYLNSGATSASALARALGVSAPFVSLLSSGVRSPPPDRCPAIERATAGQVRCETLRPDVCWVRIPDPHWPHPGGRPCIDVAAPAVGVRDAV